MQTDYYIKYINLAEQNYHEKVALIHEKYDLRRKIIDLEFKVVNTSFKWSLVSFVAGVIITCLFK